MGSTIQWMKNGVVAYGTTTYVRSDGKKVEWNVLDLAENTNSISVYTSVVVDGQYLTAMFKDALPKAQVGGSYIRFKSLADVDPRVLAKVIREAARRSR